MTHDEQRKRIFELECALGTAIKIAEQARDQLEISNNNYYKLSKSMDALSSGIKLYVRTMDKRHLLEAIDIAHSSLLKQTVNNK